MTHLPAAALWSRSDVEAFEVGMRNRLKEFGEIKKYEMKDSEKTLGDVVKYYYLWKRLPRYHMWLARKRYPSSSSVYAPFSAPIKHDEPHRQSADPRLRNRPRIDYSLSSNGSHFWSSTAVAGKRRRATEDSVDNSELDVEEPAPSYLDYNNLGVFDVTVCGDIDEEKERARKRRRLDANGEESSESPGSSEEDSFMDDVRLCSVMLF